MQQWRGAQAVCRPDWRFGIPATAPPAAATKNLFSRPAPFDFPETIAYVIGIATPAKMVPMTPERAEILALEGLGWLAGDEAGIARFMDQAGIDAATLREAAGSPGTGLAVLDFLLGNEDLL